jgi:hypothetical protein
MVVDIIVRASVTVLDVNVRLWKLPTIIWDEHQVGEIDTGN